MGSKAMRATDDASDQIVQSSLPSKLLNILITFDITDLDTKRCPKTKAKHRSYHPSIANSAIVHVRNNLVHIDTERERERERCPKEKSVFVAAATIENKKSRDNFWEENVLLRYRMKFCVFG
jgi:hypothetical protein